MATLYRQIYETVRTQIDSGQLEIGERLGTEKELAEAQGVSTITIKRALDLLRDEGLVERVPRRGTFVKARTTPPNTKLKHSKPAIGCVVTNFDDTFGTPMLGGLLDSAAQTANLIIRRSLGKPQLEESLITAFIDDGVQGIILEPTSSQWVAPSVLELVTRQFPIVIVDRSLTGIPISTVASNNVEAGRALTQHVLELGHQHIGWVSSASQVSTLQERYEGFVHAHATNGVTHSHDAKYDEVEATIPSTTRPLHDEVAALRSWVKQHPHITAFVAGEYNIALLLKEALSQEGLSVPQDKSVACFDHPDITYDLSAFRFTHIRQDQHSMGAIAVEQVLRQIEQPELIKKHELATSVVVGASTARCR